MSQWSIEQARELYNVAHWSNGFFDINDQGHVVAYPLRDHTHGIDMPKLIDEILAKGLSLPVLVRFNNMLKQRIRYLQNAFRHAMQECQYDGLYTPVYPIKVNQQRHVVECISEADDMTVGLEAGSKPELLAILGHAHKPGKLIMCNGYKDTDYIRLAFIAKKLGHRVYIIVEKFSELPRILEQAELMQVEPLLGIRIRLVASAKSKWQASSGEAAKFGLSATQVLAAVELLRERGRLDCLTLLHFHMGSQIVNIQDIQRGISECARYYAELREFGAPIGAIDVGGGLGVDYQGTRTRSLCSSNYSISEYANNIVYTLYDLCDENDLPHPHIITETGRAMAAHHAVLITNVTHYEKVNQQIPAVDVNDDDHVVIHNLQEGLSEFGNKSVLEIYHQASHWFNEAHTLYVHGMINLAQHAKAELLYRLTCIKVKDSLDLRSRPHHEIMDELNGKLADKLFCNFSLFQSIPDVWAIDQIFPILPLSDLDLPPTRRGIIEDLTCDSDGQIDFYIDGQSIENTLPLPEFNPNKPYLLGVFLIGAYQEILGDLHNLFGDTNSINVEMDDQGNYQLVEPYRGDTTRDVLNYVQFDGDKLLTSYQWQLKQSGLDKREQNVFYEFLRKGLQGYTYLSN